MLIFLGILSLFFCLLVNKKSLWYYFVSSFFLFSFVRFFGLKRYGWWRVDLFFSYDLVSSSLVRLTLWVSGLMMLANWGVKLRKNFIKGFAFLVLLLCFVLILSFYVRSFFLFYVFFELSLVPTFILILGWGYQPERLRARIYIIIYTVGASLPLLGCLLYIFSFEGHLRFLLTYKLLLGGFYGKVFFFFVVLAFFVKIPVFFVHL